MLFKTVLIFVFLSQIYGLSTDISRIHLTLDALEKALQFMEDRLSFINLDAVFGVRLVEELLDAYLRFEPFLFRSIRSHVEELQKKAASIADRGRRHVYENDKEYSATVGRLMDPSKKLLWYPSRNIDPDLTATPVPCSQSAFDENSSDVCFMEIIGSRKNKEDDKCYISDQCRRRNTTPKQQGYVLTHQVLYWQSIEMGDCNEEVSTSLQVQLCSDVMRDAKRIERARFPLNHQDLFMEQVGLCGMWGFKDFYKPEWIDTIITWQLPNGCFAKRSKWHCTDNLVPDPKTRTKRREKILQDGCLSHKTAVALLAMTASLRFEVERIYNL